MDFINQKTSTMITSNSIQTVINNLAKVLPMAVMDEQLNMVVGDVNCDGHKCGTVHCHGGWYAIAALDTAAPLYYGNGAMQMARDLGFRNYGELEDWAAAYPEIWGNKDGLSMFGTSIAFTPGTKTHASNLQDIYDHWCEVQIRLKLVELENESNN